MFNLMNIAATGPIIGPIQGILFGPIAFILIPIGNIFGGALHDYFCGMIAMRNNGIQMPKLVHQFTNKGVYNFYNVFVSLLLLLVGAVFIYIPGDLIATEVLGWTASPKETSTWVIYGVIFLYCLAGTIFPLHRFLGRLYPVLGTVLLLAALGLGYGLFFRGYITPLTELSFTNWKGIYPIVTNADGSVTVTNLLPIFFITVACGIVSGFHSTQNVLISRTVKSEREGRRTYYNMMMVEGMIAMFWAAASMALMAKGIVSTDFVRLTPTPVIGMVCRDMLGTEVLGKLGTVVSMVAIIGVIVLPLTTSDTAIRSLRLMIGEFLGIDQKPIKNRLTLSIILFSCVAAILYWAKTSPGGFTILWRYFAWSNQTLAVFAFAAIAIYLAARGYTVAPYMAILPGAWYMYITASYILNAQIGFRLTYNVANGLGIAIAVVYAVLTLMQGTKLRNSKAPIEVAPVYK